MKNFIWILKNVGLFPALKFVYHSIYNTIYHLFKPKKPFVFEELSYQEASDLAWANGIFNWVDGDRESLNKAWNDFIKHLN